MASSQFYLSARSLSTSAARSTATKLVKAPLQVFGLEGRYASALYSAGSKTKELEAIEKDLSTIQSTLKVDRRFQDFLFDPILKKSIKAEAIKDISTKSKFSASTTNLLVLLAENGRLKKLNTVANAYKQIMAAHRGDLSCEVVTAKPLDQASLAALQGVLKSFAKKGENILLDVKVDPAIIGGLIVSIGDKYVDMSIASKVKKYTDIIHTAA